MNGFSIDKGWHSAAAHGMVALLALLYLVAIILAIFGNSSGDTITTVLSPVRTVVGIIVMIAAIYFLVYELMHGTRGTKVWSIYGFLAVLVMFVAGILETYFFTGDAEQVISFVASLSFIASFAIFDRIAYAPREISETIMKETVVEVG
jgi:hypothetical protein